MREEFLNLDILRGRMEYPLTLKERQTSRTVINPQYDGYHEDLDLWNSTRTAELNQRMQDRRIMEAGDKAEKKKEQREFFNNPEIYFG